MPNHHDFLLALADYLEDDPVGYVPEHGGLREIAVSAGLCEWGNDVFVNWTSRLVVDECIATAPIDPFFRPPEGSPPFTGRLRTSRVSASSG